MKKFDMMCLNKKIKDAMKNGKHNVGRLDKLGFESMIDELNNEELCLITFLTLADIYKAEFKIIVSVMNNNDSIIRTFTHEDDVIVWYEIDKIANHFGLKQLNSSGLTMRELKEKFSKINGTIEFK